MEISFDQWLEELDEPTEFNIPNWMKVGTWIHQVQECLTEEGETSIESEMKGIITEVNVNLDLTDQDGELVVFYKVLGHREHYGDPDWNQTGTIENEIRFGELDITYHSSGDIVDHQFI